MRLCAVIAAILLVTFTARDARADSAPPVLETVVVTGAQPGPGLWRVSKDDHVLWILGTLAPLPKKFRWISRDVEDAIAHSQEVIYGPQAQLSIDGGVIGGLFLLPSLLSARNNPNDAKLADVVPAELYARWLPLRERYLGRGGAIEKRRPIFAAEELFREAVGHSGLSLDSVVAPVVRKAAKKYGVATTQPEIRIKLAQAKAAIKEFKQQPLDDIDCFGKTIARVEVDIEPMKARANAWASGDIEALRALPYADQRPSCDAAFLNAGAVQKSGLDDLRARLAQVWLDAAEKALAKNASTFAALPMREMLEDAGLLAMLRAKGYAIEPPQ